ncbi:MAG: DegV family EDD domain-containing protein [Lachnospiraceae bacterium]|nr:DegV family EDD domain-containing protein [Lachnospiraceae bacterium]
MDKIKNLFKRIYDEEARDIQERLFFVICVVGLISYAATIVTSFFIGESYFNILIMFAGLLLFLGITVLTFKYKRVKLGEFLISFLMVYVMLPLIFFTGGGIYGGAPMWFLFALLFVSMAIHGRMQIFFQISCAGVALVSYLIAYRNPDLVTFHTIDTAYADSFTQIMIIGLMIVFITSLTLSMYRSENDKAKKQKEEIDALNRAQNRFFSSMSHEIRTPINTIIGLNEMILRENISDEIAEDANNIESASKMLLQLINDILDMSKLEAGEMKIIPSMYSTTDFISELVGMFWLPTKEKGLEFIVNVDPTMPTMLLGDEIRIQQVIINIINNAIKYTKEGSITLSVQCERTGSGNANITFSVSDTGIGIKKENMPHLFSAFSRADEEENKYVEGTGLGLSIVKQLVDLMGGEVTVNSIYTQGSTFIISIPQLIANNDEIGEHDFMNRHSANRREDYYQTFEAPDAKVLVVDDNHANILVIKKLLRDTKVSIDCAESGAEALSLTLVNSYDVIFMDHLMPEMDGVECLHKMRDQLGGMSKNAKVVALTANAGSDREMYYLKEGFDAYLLKPVSGMDAERMLLSMLPENLVRLINADAELLVEHGEHTYIRNKKRPLVITSESVCDLPRELINEYNIPIISYGIHTEEGYFIDGKETDSKGVIDYMEHRGKVAHSESPTAAEYEAFFAEQLAHANNVLHITMTKGLNPSSYSEASEAAQSFENVTVIDSKNFSCGMGIVTLEAVRLAYEGVPVDGVIARLEEFLDRVQTSFMVDSLEYMKRAGRLSGIITSFANAFMVHPSLLLSNGDIKVRQVYFGVRRRAWRRFIASALFSARNLDRSRLFVAYAGLDEDDLKYIRAEIEKRETFEEIIFMEVCASIATNCGPGSFGLMFRNY